MTLIIKKPTGSKLICAKSFTWNTSVWNPRSLTSLQCWLDAADPNAFSLSGSSIVTWNDKATSLLATDAIDANTGNPTSTQRPTRATNAQNGLTAVAFDGTQWFSHNSARDMLRNRSGALMAVAVKVGVVGNSAIQWLWTQRGFGGTPNRFQMLHNSANSFNLGGLRLDADTTSTGSTFTSANPPYNTGWHIWIGDLDWANGKRRLYIDGTLIGEASYQSSGNTDDTSLGTDPLVWTAIGNYSLSSAGSTAQCLSAGSRIGEMICAARTSGSYVTADRQRLEGYLAHKWGLTANLPSNHPYKNVGPTP